MSVTLNPRARAVVEQIRNDTGVPQTEAMTRILEWFATTDRKFRLAVLNRDADTVRELARLALVEMAGGEQMGPPGNADEVAALARAAIDRLMVMLRAYERQSKPSAGGGKSKERS